MQVLAKVVRRKRGKKKKDIRSGRNQASGKYRRQRQRTNNNKLKRWDRHLARHPRDAKGRLLIEQARAKLVW